MKSMKKFLVLAFTVALVIGLVACGGGNQQASGGGGGGAGGEDLTFVIVPKVVHEWFDAVTTGAVAQADILSAQMGRKVTIDYRAPQAGDVQEQNRIMEQAAATKPHGIALDPLDWTGNQAVVAEIQAQGVPVIFFDARVPGSGIMGVTSDMAEQARLNTAKMAELLGPEGGKVAIQHGIPTASNHDERYQAMKAKLAEYPQIEVVEAPPGMDDIAISQTGAAATIAANPDLRGFLNVDAAAPVGQAAAVEEAGKAGEIIIVGAENMVQIYDYIQKGTIVGGYSVPAVMYGELIVTILYHINVCASGTYPIEIDGGLTYIDASNVQTFIDIANAMK